MSSTDGSPDVEAIVRQLQMLQDTLAFHAESNTVMTSAECDQYRRVVGAMLADLQPNDIMVRGIEASQIVDAQDGSSYVRLWVENKTAFGADGDTRKKSNPVILRLRSENLQPGVNGTWDMRIPAEAARRGVKAPVDQSARFPTVSKTGKLADPAFYVMVLDHEVLANRIVSQDSAVQTNKALLDEICMSHGIDLREADAYAQVAPLDMGACELAVDNRREHDRVKAAEKAAKEAAKAAGKARRRDSGKIRLPDVTKEAPKSRRVPRSYGDRQERHVVEEQASSRPVPPEVPRVSDDFSAWLD